MDVLLPFSIPLSGLREGVHRFSFRVDSAFFGAFEDSLLQEANVEVSLSLDKRPSLLMLEFELKGWLMTECDRCLEAFKLPVDKQYHLMVKYAEEAADEADILYIRREESELNVAKQVYDFLHLSLPMHKTHELVEGSCDPAMLAFLQQQEQEETSEETQEEKSESPWSALKDLNFD